MITMPFVMGLVLGGAGGCSCTPQLPPSNDDDDDNTTTTDDSPTTPTGDTGPEPPCAAPEVEDNDSVDNATYLPMEQRGCGAIDEPFDVDYWSFTLDDDGWLTIEASAASGSEADMGFVLTPATDPWAARGTNGLETRDASLTFLAPAGDYTLAVNEEQLRGGDRYGYEVLVTESKPPVEPWTRTEVESNDDAAQAEPVQPGDVIYGTIDNDSPLTDTDWYVITVPAGRHMLIVDVDALSVGSTADLSVQFWDAAVENNLPEDCRRTCPTDDLLCEPCEVKRGETAGDPDPYADFERQNAQIVYIQVFSPEGFDGPSNWYTIAIDLEEL